MMLIRKIIEFSLRLYLKVNYVILGKLAVIAPRNDKLLKQYLLTDHETRNWFISKCSMPLFDGLHPKNVFNHRSEFFIDNISNDDIVFDIACGTGLILKNISTVAKQGYGIDNDEKNIKICREKHSAVNLEFIEGDIFAFNYEDFKSKTSYNTVIFSHILEHIDDVPRFIRMINAEKILICVPSQENWLSQLKIYLGLPYMTDATHRREYSRAVLADELKHAGYSVKFLGFNAEGEIICRAEMR